MRFVQQRREARVGYRKVLLSRIVERGGERVGLCMIERSALMSIRFFDHLIGLAYGIRSKAV